MQYISLLFFLFIYGLYNIGDNMNVFLNENWREVFNELQPAIEEVFGSAFTGIGQQFLNRIPINQMILD